MLNLLLIFHFEGDCAHTLLDYAILIIVSLVINSTFNEKKIGKVKKVNSWRKLSLPLTKHN